jgi:hypothetical protein
MSPQSDLFDLIKSLSPSEKRYFKVYAAATGGKETAGYMKLFNFLEKMPVYDEAAIKKKFKHERFIRQLSVLKNYLHDIILRNLLHSSREYRPVADLQIQLCAVQLLYEKGLHKNCLKLIKKLKDTAWQLEEFGTLDKLYDWEGRILLNEANIPDAIKKAQEQIEIVKIRQTDLEYKLKSLEVYDFINRGDFTDRGGKQKTQKMYTALNKKQPAEIQIGNLGKYYYHTALKILSKKLMKNEDQIFHATEAIRQLERNKQFLEANLRLYITVMYNYSIALTDLGKFSELLRFVKQKRQLIHQLNEDRHREIKHEGEVLLLNIEIVLYINRALATLPRDGVAIAKCYINESRSYSNAFHILELCRNMMHALFMDEAYDEALFFLNEILNNTSYKLLPLAYAQMRFHELLIYYEMDDRNRVKSLAKTLLWLLQKQKQLLPFDQKLITFLKATIPEKKATLLNKLLSELENAVPSTVISLMQNEINLRSWLIKHHAVARVTKLPSS